MIRSFACEETRTIFEGRRSAKFPPDIQRVARRKLRQINSAITLRDLVSPPGNRLEPLQGDLAGKWSIRVNNQWRVVFAWDEGAWEVEIVDYH